MQNQDLKAKLVIIGGGGAGLTAALTAAEKGLNPVIVLEKRGGVGGTSALASGPFAAESPAQRRQAIIAPRDELFKRAMSWAHLKVNPRIVRAFIDKCGETIEWLEKMGLFFYCVPHSPIDSPLTWHVPHGDGAAIMKTLAEKCRKTGVELLVDTTGKKIITGSQGEVTGVVAEYPGRQFKIATPGVVIATGGFAGNPELLKRYCPTYRENMRLSGIPNRGDGLTMAMEAGAATDGLGMIMVAGPVTGGMFHLGGEPNRLRLSMTFISGEPATVWVNKKGRRFIDETVVFNYYESINALVRQPEAVSYALFDSAMVNLIQTKGLSNVPAGYYYGEAQRSPLPLGLVKELQMLADKGTIKISGDWDEIADWLGTPRQDLNDSILEYNAACDRGYDPVFAKDRRYLLPLRQAPFYAVKCGSSLLNTLGGIKINEKMEVLDGNDNPIRGLYAAGVDTGGWTSDTYCAMLPGTAFGWALNSGRIAGENACQLAVS
jgi:fumarate reductase flavoprotein subunit